MEGNHGEHYWGECHESAKPPELAPPVGGAIWKPPPGRPGLLQSGCYYESHDFYRYGTTTLVVGRRMFPGNSRAIRASELSVLDLSYEAERAPGDMLLLDIDFLAGWEYSALDSALDRHGRRALGFLDFSLCAQQEVNLKCFITGFLVSHQRIAIGGISSEGSFLQDGLEQMSAGDIVCWLTPEDRYYGTDHKRATRVDLVQSRPTVPEGCPHIWEKTTDENWQRERVLRIRNDALTTRREFVCKVLESYKELVASVSLVLDEVYETLETLRGTIDCNENLVNREIATEVLQESLHEGRKNTEWICLIEDAINALDGQPMSAEKMVIRLRRLTEAVKSTLDADLSQWQVIVLASIATLTDGALDSISWQTKSIRDRPGLKVTRDSSWLGCEYTSDIPRVE